MIISHSGRFLFIKPRKTAGSSFELALSPLLRAGDLATGLEPDEEPLRQVEEGVHIGPIPYRLGPIRRHLRDHSSLSQALRCFGPQLLDYRIVSMTRNPWDRAVSQFFWSMRRGDMRSRPFERQKADFIAFTRRWAPASWQDQVFGRKRKRTAPADGLYSLAGRSRADFVVRYEYLAEDTAALSNYLGLGQIHLPEVKVKSGVRSGRAKWRDFYDEETRALITRECAREIANFAYDFDNDLPMRGPRLTRES